MRHAHEGTDIAPVRNELLIEIALVPPGHRPDDTGIVLKDRPNGNQDGPRLGRAQSPFNVDETRVRLTNRTDNLALDRADFDFDDTRRRRTHNRREKEGCEHVTR